MIAVPIRKAESVVGILEVFSPHPFSFTEADHTALLSLSRSGTTILNEHKRDPGVTVLVKTGLWARTRAA
jgi:hypothetical protein